MLSASCGRSMMKPELRPDEPEPMRCASISTTRRSGPSSAARRAAASPANPAPITATCALPSPLSRRAGPAGGRMSIQPFVRSSRGVNLICIGGGIPAIDGGGLVRIS